MCTVVFWDIDGTLLTSAGAGILAWEEALHDVYGVVGADLSDLQSRGLTDGQIAVLLAESHGSGADTESAAPSLLKAYERRLPGSLRQRPGHVLPGVVEILEDFARRRDVSCLLLTGNTATGARTKLEYFRLAHYFPGDGAFCIGLDAREEIALRAHGLAAEFCSEFVSSERMYVVGDTPEDVRCGQVIGARVIAISSGIYSPQELAASNPWIVLESLPAPRQFAELVEI